MFTDCPSCQRQFRLRAEHLSAAGGEVQCGYCGQQFNALERLRDRPLQRVNEPPSSGEEQTPETDEGWFDIPEPSTGETEGPQIATAGESREAVDVEEQQDKSAPGEVSADEDNELVQPPEWLLEEEKPRRSGLSRFVWALGIVLLLAALAAQISWFNRDWLLERYPQVLPWARQVCEYFQCELIRHRDLTAIQVVNRDVRDHPRYRDALLVNATISNHSSELQPFPVVQLSLFDTAGKIIAFRRFEPAEYLDQSIDIEKGMPPDKPIHIVLEVTGPTAGAVGFEFRFLKHG